MKKTNYKLSEERVQEIKSRARRSDPYILFVGFKKIGTFKTVQEAKKTSSEKPGIYNLVKPGVFRESWVVYNNEDFI